MSAARRSLVALALVALTAASASAQVGGFTTSGGNMMSPAPVEQAQVSRPSLKQIVAQIVAKVQWRQASPVVARKAVKRNAR